MFLQGLCDRVEDVEEGLFLKLGLMSQGLILRPKKASSIDTGMVSTTRKSTPPVRSIDNGDL